MQFLEVDIHAAYLHFNCCVFCLYDICSLADSLGSLQMPLQAFIVFVFFCLINHMTSKFKLQVLIEYRINDLLKASNINNNTQRNNVLDGP